MSCSIQWSHRLSFIKRSTPIFLQVFMRDKSNTQEISFAYNSWLEIPSLSVTQLRLPSLTRPEFRQITTPLQLRDMFITRHWSLVGVHMATPTTRHSMLPGDNKIDKRLSTPNPWAFFSAGIYTLLRAILLPDNQATVGCYSGLGCESPFLWGGWRLEARNGAPNRWLSKGIHPLRRHV